jgi:two-component system, OmpR family, sensor histidine kinase QseC
MSLQRRLIVYLLLCAPLVWGLTLWASIDRARFEVNELFDTELIRLTRQMRATLGPADTPRSTAPPLEGSAQGGNTGHAELEDMAIAVWNAQGQQVRADREGLQLPYRREGSGFVDETLGGETWRLYYLQSAPGDWLVAAGQKAEERDELVRNLTLSQITPWVLMLPVLLLAMAWAVRRALASLHQLAEQLGQREAHELHAVPHDQAPTELRPLVQAMNSLFERIEATLARERRFTADAAHELRTPLAVLRAQWDVVRRSGSPAERQHAETQLNAGLDRMDRLMTQLLALSKVEAASTLARQDVQWPALVEQVMSDCLPTAERRQMELACEWPSQGQPPFPLQGDPHLLAVLLRNLLDNALRYAPQASTVTLRFSPDTLAVDNEGPALSTEHLTRLGERFHRPEGQAEGGSGLGVSIAQRIAQLHGLNLSFGPCEGGQGVRALLQRAAAHRPGLQNT